jgi:hypothetical protein
MTMKLRACCGFDSGGCRLFVAKRSNDDAFRAKTAKEWAGPDFPIEPREVNYDGCSSVGGVRWKSCEAHEVRACVATRQLATRAGCVDYTCRKLTRLHDMLGPQARATWMRCATRRRPHGADT